MVSSFILVASLRSLGFRVKRLSVEVPSVFVVVLLSLASLREKIFDVVVLPSSKVLKLNLLLEEDDEDVVDGVPHWSLFLSQPVY